MKKLFIILLLFNFFNSFSQIELKKKYQDLDILKNEIVSNIISSYSVLYGDSIRKDYVSEEDYNLYYDSLTLWYITNNHNYFKEKDEKKESTFIDDFRNVYVTDKYLINVYLENFYYYYLNKKSNNPYCIPSDFNSAKLLYNSEPNHFTYYNKNRIINYKYILKHNDNSISLKGSLYFHKTIKSIKTHGAKYYMAHNWIPCAYIYKHPIHKVFKSDNLFKDMTGLPDTFDINPKDLKLDYKFYSKYFNIEEKELCANNNDTIIIYDKDIIDNDRIKILYSNVNKNITLSNNYSIIIDNNLNEIFIKALNEGEIGLCTISIKISDNIYEYNLLKNEIIKIKINKNNKIVEKL